MTGYVLYGWHQTGSLAVEAALREAGAPYEMRLVNTGLKEQMTEAYRKIKPRQQLPNLQLPDGSIMTEGAAMLLHIGDAFPSKNLIPPPGSSQRAQHDRWLLYFAVNLYEGELRKLKPASYSDEASAPAVRKAADEYVMRHYGLFEEQLGQGPYVFDRNFSVVDIYVWMLAQWVDVGWLRGNCPKTTHLAETVMNRPAIAPVHVTHFGEGLGIKPK